MTTMVAQPARRRFVCITTKTRMVRRYVEGHLTNIAQLPEHQTAYTLLELEDFRAFGPPQACPTPPTPRCA